MGRPGKGAQTQRKVTSRDASYKTTAEAGRESAQRVINMAQEKSPFGTHNVRSF
jgi:hypothetical protein